MTSTAAAACIASDAELLMDLGIGYMSRTDPSHADAVSPRGLAAARPPIASPAPSVVDLLSDSDIAASPDARDAVTGLHVAAYPPAPHLPAPQQQDRTDAAADARPPSVMRLLEGMVDLLSASDDDQDAALAAALAAEGDCDAAMAGLPCASPPRRKSSNRRIRKPARFKDPDAGPASPTAERRSAQRDAGGADCGPTVWPSPPEDSFINDAPADSAPVSPNDVTDPSLPPKRCELVLTNCTPSSKAAGHGTAALRGTLLASWSALRRPSNNYTPPGCRATEP